VSIRNANIALVVFAAVLFTGVFLFRNAGEGPQQIVMLVALVVGFGTLTFLDARDDRREQREERDQ
jgi:hypothetical protein